MDCYTLEKLMSRCIKLYKTIDQFIDIFKLISKKERLETKSAPTDEHLEERLKTAINLLSSENPILPSDFKFKGRTDWIKREAVEAVENKSDRNS